MSRSFSAGATPPLKAASLGVAIAAVGVAVGFIGSAGSHREISIFGFGVCVLGVFITFAAILFGWVRYGRQIINEVRDRYLK